MDQKNRKLYQLRGNEFKHGETTKDIHIRLLNENGGVVKPDPAHHWEAKVASRDESGKKKYRGSFPVKLNGSEVLIDSEDLTELTPNEYSFEIWETYTDDKNETVVYPSPGTTMSFTVQPTVQDSESEQIKEIGFQQLVDNAVVAAGRNLVIGTTDVVDAGQKPSVTQEYKNGKNILTFHMPAGVPGPQGPEGKQGIQGIQGPQGARGLPGATGEPGKNGKDGVDGKNGTNGKDGISPKLDKVNVKEVDSGTDASGSFNLTDQDSNTYVLNLSLPKAADIDLSKLPQLKLGEIKTADSGTASLSADDNKNQVLNITFPKGVTVNSGGWQTDGIVLLNGCANNVNSPLKYRVSTVGDLHIVQLTGAVQYTSLSKWTYNDAVQVPLQGFEGSNYYFSGGMTIGNANLPIGLIDTGAGKVSLYTGNNDDQNHNAPINALWIY